MGEIRRRRRRSGSLPAIKTTLWATARYCEGVLEDSELPHELRLSAANALMQACQAHMKASERLALDARTRVEQPVTETRMMAIVREATGRGLRRGVVPPREEPTWPAVKPS